MLIILTALGAILVPIIGNAITRSHLATCLTNFPEVTKMLNTARAVNGSMGNNWTNPVDARVSNDTVTGVDQFPAANVGQLTQDQIDALADLGLETFTSVPPTAANVTFDNGVESQTPTVLTPATDVVVLAPGEEAGLFLPAPGANQQYVFFTIDKS